MGTSSDGPSSKVAMGGGVGRWLLPALAVLLWLGLSAPLGGLSGKLSQVQQNDNAAFLPSSAESTRVTELQRRFAEQQALPLLVLWEADGPLDQPTLDAIGQKATELTGIAERSGALASAASPPIGVYAPASWAASIASFKSLSISTAANPPS